MTNYSNIPYSNHDNSKFIKFSDISVDNDQEYKRYNSTMTVEVKNDFLTCKLISATFHSQELFAFFDGIERIRKSLSGKVSLQSVEHNCYLTIQYIDNGYISISGLLQKLGEHNICDFIIYLDQTCFNKKLSVINDDSKYKV